MKMNFCFYNNKYANNFVALPQSWLALEQLLLPDLDWLLFYSFFQLQEFLLKLSGFFGLWIGFCEL